MRFVRLEPIFGWRAYMTAFLVTLAATIFNRLISPYVANVNLVMVYLLGVAYVASRTTVAVAFATSLASVAMFDLWFVHPIGTFAVADVQYLLTFAVMFVVSLLIGSLTVRLREQSAASRDAAIQVHVEKVRGDLLSAVSHDLRTPLAGIEGSAGVLIAQPELSDQSRQLAMTIQEESTRMARLIRDLLDMTRVQDAIELDLDWNALDELAANAIERTATLFDRRVALTSDGASPIVKVDGVLIEQVFVNLLENASRHAGRQAAVAIEIRSTESQVVVDVLDDGPGIPPDLKDAIFDRFRSGNRGGFGLGLAICRSALVAHGGSIVANDRPGGGAAFHLEFPKSREDLHG